VKAGRGAGVVVIVAEAVGVGDKVGVSVIVGVAEAVRVGEGMLVAVHLGGRVMVARIAVELAVGFCVAGALQPARNNNGINEIRPRWMCKRVIAFKWHKCRLVAAIQFHALVTVKKE
jgi:hypothetical protein